MCCLEQESRPRTDRRVRRLVIYPTSLKFGVFLVRTALCQFHARSAETAETDKTDLKQSGSNNSIMIQVIREVTVCTYIDIGIVVT